jgi:polysaccharide export outer membrane protein
MEQPVSNARTQKRIMPFDNLYIRVLSTDEKTAQIFNATEPFRNDVSPNLISYLVDENGNINFPFAGQIAVSGLTTTDASEKIQKALSEYIANTDVIVKYIDNKVTVMGEVQRQGVYNFTSDKLNIYDAIALAGGMTKYGNHKKVVLVRQENKNIMHYNLDLSTSDISATKYYFINPNDVIVVEPLWHISTSYENTTYTTLLTTITTLVTLLYFFRQR